MTAQPMLMSYTADEVEDAAQAVSEAKVLLDESAEGLAVAKAEHKARTETFREALSQWLKVRAAYLDGQPDRQAAFQTQVAGDLERLLGEQASEPDEDAD